MTESVMFLVVLIYYHKSQVAVRRGLSIIILYVKSLQVATVFNCHGKYKRIGVTTISVKAINLVMCLQCLKQCQSILVSLVCVFGLFNVSVRS